ncbi:MAG: helix-turn-helix transcriptional regulator [Eggerthellaceae bacterium]|nr:helix-turn-helix transcriptional regulator [Eggerthellaceae bacterium]
MRSDEFMNAEDVARYLNLGKNTVYQLAKSGKLASYHVGRKLKFTLDDVEAYVASTHHATGDVPSISSAPKDEPDDDESLTKAASFGDLAGVPFVIAGGDTAADMLAGVLNASGTPTARKVCGSYTALVHLYANDADAAVVHLYDQASNSCNVPYVRNLAPGASVVVFRLYGRQQGFIVQTGNPKNISTWGGLLREGVRLANRSKGSGSRVLLDEKLRAMEARAESIEGYDTRYAVGSTAARRVSSGVADVAIGTEREMHGINGVQFVPLQSEWVDLVVRKTPETRTMIKRLKELMATEQLRHDIASLQPCDPSRLGVIVYES